jgi:cysteine sulfinate desulfinase/cysteine desulfurase-like protein
MKSFIFLDQATSYHPLGTVREILTQDIHPHSLSSRFQTREFLLKLTKSKQAISRYFGCEKQERLVLTAGGEEALVRSLDLHYHQDIFHSGKQHILIARSDVARVVPYLEKYKSLGVVWESVETNSQGHMTPEILAKAITPRTSLLICSWADAFTGMIQPISDLLHCAQEKGVSCLVDVSQVIGKLYFSLEDFPIDYAIFDAKPFHGPYQVGGVFLRHANTQLIQQELFPLQIEALESALEYARDTIDHMNLEVARLRQLLEATIIAKIPDAHLLFQDVERLPHIAVIAFPYLHREYFLYRLAQENLYASTLLEQVEKSIDPFLAHCCLSFSLSHMTTEEEIEEAAERICKQYNQAKQLFSFIEEES